jgi:XTP/dITP diphosphohydrolase
MARKFKEQELLIATANKGKIEEYKTMFDNFKLKPCLKFTNEFPYEEPEETGFTFVENAILKANYYGERTALVSLADDSGIEIDALGGEPGIYSARWAGGGRDFSIAFNRIKLTLDDLKLDSSNANFVCVIALRWPDGYVEHFTGKIHGKIKFPPRGDNGFGYDPIFIPNGYDCTIAEMDKDQKNQISHRMQAFKQMVSACFE